MSNNEVPENPWKKRVLWLVLLVALVGLQWPMLKGTYYKHADRSTSSPESTAVDWKTDFEVALAESAKTGKPILIDFTASWCPPCVVMKKEVWPDREVGQAVNEQSIPLLLDIDLPQNKSLAIRYDVSSIPSLILVDAEGKVLRSGGYMTSSEVIDFVSKR